MTNDECALELLQIISQELINVSFSQMYFLFTCKAFWTLVDLVCVSKSTDGIVVAAAAAI